MTHDPSNRGSPDEERDVQIDANEEGATRPSGATAIDAARRGDRAAGARREDAASSERREDATTGARRQDSASGARRQDAATGAMLRRDYLRALGVTGAAGAVGSTATTATAQAAFDEAAADQRIRENQTRPLTVEVVDQEGDPVTGATVDVEMQEHEFVWGAEVAANLLVQQYGEGDPYVEHLLDLFNTGVLENIHKWALWEGDQSLADDAVDWLDEHGFRIRGHTCIYPVDYAIPGDVQTAIDSGDAQTIRNRTMGHIEEIITHYGDRVQEWDVVNEVLHRGLLHSGVYPGQVNLDDLPAGQIQPWTSQLLADWFSHAESVIDENGLDVDVVTNDYNTMTWSYARDRYAEQIDHLQSQGVGVDGIGLQSHIGPGMGSGESWTYANVDEVFEHYAQFDTNVRITEYDMAGEDWTGHQQRADVLERFLKTAYGHPNVDEFTVWGFWDGAHWQDEAPFFEEDWSEKPAVDVWRTLVQDEWWTSETGTTGSDGTYTVDAFLGEHEVSVSTDADSTTREVSVTDASDGQRLVVSVEGDDDPTDATAVNAGGSAHETSSGRAFATDAGATGGTTNSTSDSIAATDEDPLYRTERYGESFAYEFDLAAGTYDIHLHFVELYHEADAERVFDVTVNGATAFSDLDVHAAVGHDAALERTVQDVRHSGGTLTVGFEASTDNATVSAIAVDEPTEDDTCADAAGGDAEVDGQTVCDVNGDGYYRDLTGDGDVGQGDVAEFFSKQHRSAWKRPELFDFSENGVVTHGDVVDLFDYVALN